MSELCLREYGLLVRGTVLDESLDVRGVVSAEAWAFFENLAYSEQKTTRVIEVARYGGRKALRVKNFVGVIAAPDGTQVDILPKICEGGQDLGDTRALLWKMLGAVENLRFLETTQAQLMLRSMPLLEALVSIFLDQVGALVRRGIRRDYERVEEEEHFLRGRLQLGLQMQQPAGRQHLFRIEYDVYSENRAENRLIHAALIKVARSCRTESNQRRARELRHGFESVSISRDYTADFQAWRCDRAMISYQPLLPWLRLILDQQSPFSLKDAHQGISFLFPMESLFEKYVAITLNNLLDAHPVTVHTQLSGRYMAECRQSFQLKPDLALERDGQWLCILDTKWKLIERRVIGADHDSSSGSGISQSDMYQLYAYGQKYLRGSGRVVLIYPQWRGFDQPLPCFDLGGGLFLDVLPFDLHSDGMQLVSDIFDGIADDVEIKKIGYARARI